ncbi:MAG: 6-phosphofructokinase [Mycoplasmoidaceae bacterium]|nr:6-phosphofructokinase [Mycoplasmoidaceae bacterium]
MKKTSNAKKVKQIAVLASGGNSPGMNNVAITLVKKAISLGITPYLIYDGYKGLLEGNFKKVDRETLR